MAIGYTLADIILISQIFSNTGVPTQVQQIVYAVNTVKNISFCGRISKRKQPQNHPGSEIPNPEKPSTRPARKASEGGSL